MSIEVKLQELIDAINANTAAIKAKAASASSGSDDAVGDEKKTSTRGRRKPADAEGDEKEEKTSSTRKPKITREALTTIMNKVKEDVSTKAAKEIIAKVGAERLAEIDDADIAKAYKMAEDALAEAEAEGADADDDI